MISKKDFNRTKANSKSTQGERIFVTDKKREREQIIIKWKITKIREMTDKMREWPMAPFISHLIVIFPLLSGLKRSSGKVITRL